MPDAVTHRTMAICSCGVYHSGTVFHARTTRTHPSGRPRLK